MQLRTLPPSRRRAAVLSAPDLSPAARTRLQALTIWQRTGDWRLAAQVFGLSRATLFRWRRRYEPHDLTRLEARSRRPRQVRRPQPPRLLLPGSAPCGNNTPAGDGRSYGSGSSARASPCRPRPSIGCWPGCGRSGNSSSRRGRRSPLIGGGAPARTPAANPATIRAGRPAI
jgi:hypothetical protein